MGFPPVTLDPVHAGFPDNWPGRFRLGTGRLVSLLIDPPGGSGGLDISETGFQTQQLLFTFLLVAARLPHCDNLV